MLTEFLVVGFAMVILMFDAFAGEKGRRWLAPLALAGLALAFLNQALLVPQHATTFGGRYALDGVTWWFKLLFLLAGILTVLISVDLTRGRMRHRETALEAGGEYYTLLLLTMAGMLFLASSRDLVALYVSLELATIPLFALVAWKRNALSGEAALKYLVTGALSSALLLFGLGLLYGLSGTTDLASIRAALTPSPALWLAAALVTAGVGFKLTLVPFHMWAADVYEGAPTPVTAYLSVASKGAGLALIFQLYFRVFGDLIGDWGMLIAALATITMTLGNLVAMVQTNIKRFMAFSAISQAGYLLLGFLGPQPAGVSAMIFYLLVYVVTNLAVFAVIIYVAGEYGSEEISGYRGLSRTSPLVALVMMIALFSLAGVPPLSAFVGKFFLFSVAARAGYHWLVAVAALNSTVSLYYYLRIVRQMYIEAPAEAADGAVETRSGPGLVLGATIAVTGVASVVVGIIPVFYETISRTTTGWLASLLK